MLSGTKEIPFSQRMLPLLGVNGEPSLEKKACVKPASLEEEPCVLGLRKKVNHKAPSHNSELQPQEPNLSVLENTPRCASGLRTGVSEEPAAPKMEGPLGNPENTVQLRPGPKQASSPRLCPASPPAAPTLETELGKRTKQGNGRFPQPEASPGQNTSSSRSPTPGLKFSFLKGQRQALMPSGKASLQHSGPWKVLCSLYSPKPNQAKFSRKGKVPTQSAEQGNYSLDSIK